MCIRDRLLILHYYNRYGYIPAGKLPLEDIVFNYRAYGLPCFETIRRADVYKRQQYELGSIVPDLCRNDTEAQTVKSLCSYLARFA